MQVTVNISGMGCAHCVEVVTKALQSLPGVRGVHIDLNTGKATIEKPQDVTLDDIAKAVKDAGYRLV